MFKISTIYLYLVLSMFCVMTKNDILVAGDPKTN